MYKMRKTKAQKGITLIALIITIVVLLILAVVAIRSIQGDGIISHAKQSQKKYSKAQVEEKVNLALQEWVIYKNTPNATTLYEFLQTKFNEVIFNTDQTITIVEDGYVITVTANGKIGGIQEFNSELPYATNIKVVDASGNEPEENSVAANTELYITFTPEIKNGKITSVEIGDSQLDKDNIKYAVTKNGYYQFTLKGTANKKEYTNTVEVAVNKYKYQFQKVNYNELSNGTKTYTLKGTDSGTGTDVTLTAENLDWRLFKITDDGKIFLIPSNLLTTQTVTLTSSKNSFLNGPDILNNICNELYGKGTYAAKARSATVEDFNEFTGYDPTVDETSIKGDTSCREYGKYYYYRIYDNGKNSRYWVKDSGNLDWNVEFPNGELAGGYGTGLREKAEYGNEMINPETGFYVSDVTKEEVRTCYRNTAYEYIINDHFDLKSLLTDLGLVEGYKIYNTIKDSQFWLASRYTLCSEWRIGFGLRCGNTGKIKLAPMGDNNNHWQGRWSESEEAVTSRSYKLCPIVELDSSQVELTKSNNTWQITAK